MNEPLLLKCPSVLHCDGLEAEMLDKGIKFARWDSKRIICNNDISDEFCNMVVHHCAFTDGWHEGQCTMDHEQIVAWEKLQ